MNLIENLEQDLPRCYIWITWIKPRSTKWVSLSVKCSFYRFDRRFVADENILSTRKVELTIMIQEAEGITVVFFASLKIFLIISKIGWKMFIQGRFDNKEMSGIHVCPSYNASAATRYYYLIRLASFCSFAFHTHLKCSFKLDRWNECKQPTSLNYCSLWKYSQNVHVNSRNFSTPRGRFEPLHLLPCPKNSFSLRWKNISSYERVFMAVWCLILFSWISILFYWLPDTTAGYLEWPMKPKILNFMPKTNEVLFILSSRSGWFFYGRTLQASFQHRYCYWLKIVWLS